MPETPPPSERNLNIGNQATIGGDVVGRDKIIYNLNIIQRTAAEEVAQTRDLERQRLAQGVSGFVQRLLAQAEKKADSGGPYKGLLEYRLSDSELFFGRERAIRDLMQNLGRGPLTVLHSESGTGKTSLLQAGISPRLIGAGHLPLYLRPYNVEPLLAIKRAFISDPSQTPILAAAPLRDFLRQVSDVLGLQTTLYILIDQFEELFTQLSELERGEFIRELAECIYDETLNVRWALALRSEYFGNLANFRPHIRNPFENDFCLTRLTRAEAEEVITKPAERQGLTFEPGLIDTLLDDLGKTEIAPPQIQLVCLSLFDELEPGETSITHALYDREGGAAGILRGHLERVLSRDLPAPQRAAARRLLESLITSEQQRVVRSHAELVAELSARGITPATLDVILNQLVDSRLLKVDETESGLVYELAHDYLLNEIKIDPDVQARKAAQELLEQEVRAYRRYKTLLTKDRLKIIDLHIAEMRLTEEAEQMLLESRSSIQQKEDEEQEVTKKLDAMKPVQSMLYAISEGNLSLEGIDMSRVEEIGDWAEAVHTLTLRLRERTAEAARLYAESIQRNKELAQINMELQVAREQLVQSEILAATGQFMTSFINDIKNPLAVVVGMLDELRDDESIDLVIRSYLSTIQVNARRANVIIDSFLRFSRSTLPEMKLQDISATVRTAIGLIGYLARKSHVNIVIDIPDNPIMATYDAIQLEHVLINLIQNAIQAMPEGGKASVVVAQIEDSVAIAVQDTGLGISPENMSRLFDPFFTTRPPGEGTGLGLSLDLRKNPIR